LVRITTLGEFALERLVRTPSRTEDEPPRYARVTRREWSNRGPAMALLKVLLCRQNPLPLLEKAHALAAGEFLEDDLYAEWAQGRRHTINGARHRVLFKLVDLYLQDERVGLAEELLFAALEEDPTDEDALCRLMVLLVEQQRRQEALHLYHYTEDVLQEEQTEPAIYRYHPPRRRYRRQAALPVM
jgi:hypothetical protein